MSPIERARRSAARSAPSTPADLQATADFDRLLWTHLSRSPSFSGLDVAAQDFESEWSTLWEETTSSPTTESRSSTGASSATSCSIDRPTGDLRVPEQNIDLAHAATREDARGTGAMRALMAGAIDWAREQGYRSFTTDWRSSTSRRRATGPARASARPSTGSSAPSRRRNADRSTIALFSLAAVALAVVPGPAVAYIVTQSVDKGRRAGLVSALGVASGGIVHVAAATVGLSALIASSATAFTASSSSAPRT